MIKNKKTFIIFLMLILAFASASLAFSAHSDYSKKKAGITPESPLYFIDGLAEDIQSFFVFNSQKKAEIQIDFIGERLSEAEDLMSRNSINREGIEEVDDMIDKYFKKAGLLVSDLSKEERVETITGMDKRADRYLSDFDKGIDEVKSNLRDRILDDINEFKNISSSTDFGEEDFNLAYEKVNRLKIVESNYRLIRKNFKSYESSLEDKMTDEERIKDGINELKNDFERLRAEADKEDIGFPPGTFMTLTYFDFIEQASSSFSEGDLSSAAERLEEAKDSFDAFRETLIELKENKFKEYESEIKILEAEFYFSQVNESNITIEKRNRYIRLISEARAEFNAGNFEESSSLADEAKDIVITINN